jgi:hypothetical protein
MNLTTIVDDPYDYWASILSSQTIATTTPPPW